jgi:ABC-type glycerol-3-phosphate transport system substrate-binding protein
MQLRGRAGSVHRGVAGLAACLTVAACSSAATSSAPAPSPGNHYRQVNLAANSEAYRARFTIPDMVNA